MKKITLILFVFTIGLFNSIDSFGQSATDAYKLELNIADFKKTTTIAQLYTTLEPGIKVLSYSIEYNTNGFLSGNIIENGRLSGAHKKAILAEFPAQTKVSITEVKAKMADGKIKTIKPLIITLKE